MISITVDSGIDNNSSLSSDSLVNSNSVSSESDLKRNLENDIFSKANPKFTFNNYVTGESNIVHIKLLGMLHCKILIIITTMYFIFILMLEWGRLIYYNQ